MKYIVLLFFFLFVLILSAQNLAPNPKFENFTDCPSVVNTFPLVDWYLPTIGTSDYFHPCGGAGHTVPFNFTGYQDPATGSAYVGQVTYRDDAFYREFIQAALTSPTIEGACYKLTIIYSPADQTGYSDGLSMYLSAGIPSDYVDLPAQLIKTTIEEDKSLWHTLTTHYISLGGETHITIGNFQTDENTSHVPEGNIPDFAYYFIDSVAVEYMGIPSFDMDVDLGPDLDVCNDDFPMVITSNFPTGTNEWNTGETGPSIIINTPGLYSVQTSFACDSGSDEIEINIIPAPSFGIDSQYQICAGDSINLSIASNLGDIQWSSGSIDTSEIFKDAGIYYVSITNSCKTYVDTFILSYLPQLNPLDLGPDIGICQGGSTSIEAGVFDGNYLWNTEETTFEIDVNVIGQYWLEIEGQCTIVSDTINIFDLGQPPIIDLGEDLTFCDGDSVVVDIGDLILDEILWNTSSTESSIIINAPGTYIVFGTNACGSSSDTIVATINNELTPIELGEDKSICPGDSILLDLGIIPGEITWNNGESGSSIYAYSEGFYIATLNSTCGESIDTIFIEELDAAPEVDLGTDTVLCEGDNLEIFIETNNSNTILWSDGSDELFNSFSETATIWLELSNECGVVNDSLELIVIESLEPIELPIDITICDEQTYLIPSGISQDNVNILWNTDEVVPSIEVMESGTYWVTANNFCFEESDTIVIEFLDSPTDFDLGEDDTICFGESVYLDAFQGDGYNYLWQDNNNQATYTATESGIYSLEISNFCGAFNDEIEIMVLSNTTFENTFEDNYILCPEEILNIDLSSFPFDNVLWNDGSTDLERILSIPGVYFIDLKSICFDTLISINLEHKNCDIPGIYVPNLFTPNNDGVNDFFSIGIADLYELSSLKVSIFNRWGEKIYYSEELDFQWDGKFKGQSTNSGVFAYFIELDVELDGVPKQLLLKGDVTIIK